MSNYDLAPLAQGATDYAPPQQEFYDPNQVFDANGNPMVYQNSGMQPIKQEVDQNGYPVKQENAYDPYRAPSTPLTSGEGYNMISYNQQVQAGMIPNYQQNADGAGNYQQFDPNVNNQVKVEPNYLQQDPNGYYGHAGFIHPSTEQKKICIEKICFFACF